MELKQGTRMKPKHSTSADITKLRYSDICQTPAYALDCLWPYIHADTHIEHAPGVHGGHDMYRSSCVWESACGPDELLVERLQTWGFQVIATDLLYGFNFFDFKPDIEIDYHITNPPYSIKYEWLARSFELGIPFALLVPYETTFAAKFQKLYHQYHNNPWKIEVVSPTRRINFKMPQKGWSGGGAQMPTCWVTWGLHIEQQRKQLKETSLRDQYCDEGFVTYYMPMERNKDDEL